MYVDEIDLINLYMALHDEYKYHTEAIVLSVKEIIDLYDAHCSENYLRLLLETLNFDGKIKIVRRNGSKFKIRLLSK